MTDRDSDDVKDQQAKPGGATTDDHPPTPPPPRPGAGEPPVARPSPQRPSQPPPSEPLGAWPAAPPATNAHSPEPQPGVAGQHRVGLPEQQPRAEQPPRPQQPPRAQQGPGDGRPAPSPPPPARHHASDSGWPNTGPQPRPGLQNTNADTPPHLEASAEEQASWGEDYQQPPASASAATNWSYVEGFRTSELVPTRKIPPGRGWRRVLHKSTFGLVNLGLSRDERRQAELETKIRSLLRGHYKIGVLGKGGTGKTTVAAAVGSIIASLRQDDRVVAIDADTAFGKLGSRIDPRAAGSYWELAADQHLHSFADIRSRVGNNDAGLFVLAGEGAISRRRVINPRIYREAVHRLDNHFTISVIDCGSTMDAPVTHEVLRDLDALLVVSSPWVDGASAAGQTMDWLTDHGYTGLLHRTVVVLNDSDGHANQRTRELLREQFASRGQTVVEVPYDAHLRPGGVIDVDIELNRTTRRRFVEIAAAIAEHFVTTTDGPRERR